MSYYPGTFWAGQIWAARQIAPGLWILGRICETGRHDRHSVMPWMYERLYVHDCLVPRCPFAAAWASIGGQTLCDCHVADWHMVELSKHRRDWDRSFARFLEMAA